MPSTVHEILIELFRNRPELAPRLLREALHVKLPTYAQARIESADLTDIQPAEYRADLVVLLYNDQPVLGIVVEVQLSADERKRYAWPVYAVGLRARMRCPVCVLVFTPGRSSHELGNCPLPYPTLKPPRGGLTNDELAFYDALEVNDSAVKVLGDEALRKIARELVDTVRNNVTIDWAVKESVRAKLRVIVKRILRKYGYPPAKQEAATNMVLQRKPSVNHV